MVVNTQQVQMGVVNYIEQEIARKAVGVTKFGVYFMLPKMSKSVVSLINKYQSNPMFEDLFDENGNIKLDDVYNMSKEAIKHSGQFEMFGIIFNESDIDKLYSYIKNTGG